MMVLAILLAVGTIMLVQQNQTNQTNSTESSYTYPSDAQAQECVAAYPDICVEPGVDINCSDLTEKDIIVLPPDPAGLDRDNNGLGCES